MRGNCYVSSEALYHILGGKKAGWIPQVMHYKGDTHWFLRHRNGFILDPSNLQFGAVKPNYSNAHGSGFLTKQPSKRAKQLIKELTWQKST